MRLWFARRIRINVPLGRAAQTEDAAHLLRTGQARRDGRARALPAVDHSQLSCELFEPADVASLEDRASELVLLGQ